MIKFDVDIAPPTPVLAILVVGMLAAAVVILIALI